MERGYIEALQVAYDRFFGEFDQAPVLVIDTEGVDIVNDLEARSLVVNKVKAALQGDSLQLPLLDMDDPAAEASSALSNRRRLADFQRFHRALDREKGFIADLFFDYICLTEEVGEIGRVIKQTWRKQDALLPQTGNRQEAMDRALDAAKADLQEELADALAFLLKIANDSGIDLEAAYLSKMDRNLTRAWPNT
jgi:NTP pyrophosphatase (non-canonical NTP hydrolase)